MATWLFSDAHLGQLRSFPDIDRDQLIRFFTLTPADVAFIDPGRGRGPADRLGLAVQLCTLPWLGFVPDEVTAAPAAAIRRLAERLQVDPGVLVGYGRRGQTRTDHLRLVAGYLGWHQAPPGSVCYMELRQFLLDRAMEHDSPTLLFNLAAGYLISAKVIRPGLVTLMELIGWARAAATSLTHQKVAHLLTPQLTSDLDRLLMVDAGLGKTRLAWLNERIVEATAATVNATAERLRYLRALDAHNLDLSMLPAEAAAWRLADLLADRGELDEAAQRLRGRADADEGYAAWRLAGLLAQRGDLEELRGRADAGDEAAAWRLADLLADRGDLAGLRTRADAGDPDAAWRLVELLAQQGRGDEAARLRQFGLNPDGSIAHA